MQSMGVQLSWRPIMVEDAAAWAALLAAVKAVDGTGEHYSVEDLLEELADPNLDIARETVAAFDGDRMVAYGLVRGAGVSRGMNRMHTEGCVHPEVAGYLLSYEYEADSAGNGVREAWVGQLDTRRSWRAYGDAGYERAGLGVDSGNPSGALSLYERIGFVVNQHWTTYARPL
jgi:ribosomal protein S18 acetylase RimI-like enzyme